MRRSLYVKVQGMKPDLPHRRRSRSADPDDFQGYPARRPNGRVDLRSCFLNDNINSTLMFKSSYLPMNLKEVNLVDRQDPPSTVHCRKLSL